MEGYASEEQQVESIKKWWKENGKSIFVGLVLGSGIVIGGKLWIDNRNTQIEMASVEYQKLTEEIEQKNNEAIVQLGQQIINTYTNTPYAAFSALALAKVHVEDKDLESARSRLQWVLDSFSQPEINHVARLRLARVLLAESNGPQALALLKPIEPENYLSSYEEIKGDIHVSMEQTEQARVAYTKALDAILTGDKQQLQMKLDDLGPEE